MPKGYWIVRVDVSDPDAYRQIRRGQCRADRPLRRAGSWCAAGRTSASRARRAPATSCVEFPSFEAARACYDDAGLPARPRQLRVAASIGDFVIIEGYDGPQPGD